MIITVQEGEIGIYNTPMPRLSGSGNSWQPLMHPAGFSHQKKYCCYDENKQYIKIVNQRQRGEIVYWPPLRGYYGWTPMKAVFLSLTVVLVKAILNIEEDNKGNLWMSTW